MIAHVSIGVRDLARTKRFYDAALKPLGYACQWEKDRLLGYGLGKIAFWISPVAHPVAADIDPVCTSASPRRATTASTLSTPPR